MSSRPSGVVSWAGLVGGVLLADLGCLSAVANILAFYNGEPWTVSLGGLVAGFGVGIAASSFPVGDGDRHTWPGIVLTVIGSTAAGMFFGGSIDEFLRSPGAVLENLGLAMPVVGIAAAMAVFGWLRTTERSR